MTVQGNYKTFIALLLLLLLINPMLVKSLHRHHADHRHCSKGLAEGINSLHHQHHENCEICSFEYVNVLLIDPDDPEVHLSEIRDLFLPDSGSGHSASLLFASPRAPPAYV